MTKEEHLANVELEKEKENVVENTLPEKGIETPVDKKEIEKIPETITIEAISFKDKVISKTDDLGITESGNIVKGVFWGVGIGVALTLAYYNQEKIKTFLKLK